MEGPVICEVIHRHEFATHQPWDRSETVGASEVGQCLRRTWFGKFEDHANGVRRDPDRLKDKWGAKRRGALIEQHLWLPAMRHAYGARLIWAGPEQRTFVSGNLSATPDGVLISLPRDALTEFGIPDLINGDGSSDRSVVVDCKSFDPRTVLEEVKVEHLMQVNTQIGLIRESTNYRPRIGLLTYIDCSWFDEIREFLIIFDQKQFEHAKRRADKIMAAVSFEELPPEGWIGGGRECEHCPWTITCGRARSAVPTDPDNRGVDPQRVVELIDLGRSYKDAKDAEASAIEFSRSLMVDLKRRLKECNTTRVSQDGTTVTWSPVKGRAKVDIDGLCAAAEEAGVDTAPFKSAGEPGDRLVVTTKPKPETEELRNGASH
jgi:hypothetical protein